MVLRDSRLSFTARGILAFLLSLPDGARHDAHTLADGNPGVGRRGVSKALDELILHGYYVRRAVRDDAGRVRTETAVYDTPQGKGSQLKPTDAFPSSGGPIDGVAVTNPKGFKTQEENTNPPTTATSEVPEPVRPADVVTEGGEGSNSLDDKTAACAALVARLGRVEPRLTVGQREMGRVLPLVAEWLGRGATEAQIRATLTTGLPDELRSPVALIIHRLKAKMPAPMAVAPKVVKVPAAECSECSRPVARPGVCSLCVAESDRKPGPIADVARHVAIARELLTARRPAAVAA